MSDDQTSFQMFLEIRKNKQVRELWKSAAYDMQRGLYSGCIYLCQEAIEVEKKSTINPISLALLYCIQCSAEVVIEEYEDAILSADESLKYKADFIEPLLSRDKVNFELDNEEESYADLVQVLNLNPDIEDAKKLIKRLRRE